MLAINYHALGFTGTRRDFHQILNLGRVWRSVNPSALLSANDNAFAQGILSMTDFEMEHFHKVLEKQIAGGYVSRDSTARKEIAWIHEYYQNDIQARNQKPLSDEEVIERLIEDLGKSNPRVKRELDFLRASIDESQSNEWLGVHNVVFKL